MELCFDHETKKISQDTSLIKGSHGYPPSTDQDNLPFIVSGAASDDVILPDDFCVTDVASLIDQIL